MITLDEVLSRLDKVKKCGSEWKALCPAHEDINASLTVREGDDGKILFRCHAGCSYAEIMTALKIEKVNTKPAISKTYDYVGEYGDILYQVVRYIPKSFRQRRPDGQGGWLWNLKGVDRVLYNLPALNSILADSSFIFLVEGEKDADNLIANELIATTMSGGAAAEWQTQYTETLKDKRVILLPDNDAPGHEWADKIGSILYKWCDTLSVINLPDLPEKGDVSDWLKTHTTIELLSLSKAAPPYMPPAFVRREELEAIRNMLMYIYTAFLKQRAFRNNPARMSNKYE